MSSKSRTSKQARAQLRKLRDLGLYKGDLRKAPSKYALKRLDAFSDVLAGKAAVVKPKNPDKFKNIYRTVGDSVVVPKRKGERISVDKKSGEIVSIRKTGKGKYRRIIRARGRTVKKGEAIETPPEDVNRQYVIPFNGRDGKTNWFRFPSYDELQKFMAGYDYKGWEDYVVEEDVDNELDDDELNERLERKRKGRKIKGNPNAKRGSRGSGPKLDKRRSKKSGMRRRGNTKGRKTAKKSGSRSNKR